MTARQIVLMLLYAALAYVALLAACSAFWMVTTAVFGGPLP